MAEKGNVAMGTINNKAEDMTKKEMEKDGRYI